MKKFLVSGGIFLLLLVAVNVYLNALVYEVYYQKYEQVETGHDAYLFADSHGLPLEQHLKPGNIYNFSAASDSYFDMLRKVKYLIREGGLKTVIITVDDHTLSKYREGANNLDRSAVYASAEDFSSFLEYLKVKYLKRHFALFNPKSRNILREIFKGKLKSETVAERKAKEWQNLSAEEQNKLALIRAKEQFPDRLQSEDLMEELDELILLSQENKIRLVGIKFPVSAPFYQLIKDKGYGADSLFESRGINVIDYTTIYLNNPEYFKDQDHLSDLGGVAFAKLLTGQIKDLNGKTVQ